MVIVLLTLCDAAVNLELTVWQLLLTTFTVVFRSSAPPFVGSKYPIEHVTRKRFPLVACL